MRLAAALLMTLLLAQQRVEVDFGTTTARRVKLLRHRNARVRARAAMLLAHASPDEAIAGLLVCLRDSAPQVRIAAAGSLAQMRDERAVPTLAARLRTEPSPTATSAFLMALAHCGGPYVAHRIVPFLDHPARPARAAAAQALGRLGDAGQRDALWAALRYAPDDPAFLVRSSILNSFVSLGWTEDVARAIGELEEAGAHRHWRSRAAICGAVGRAGVASRTTWLRELLQAEADPRVLAAGIDSLARLGLLDEVHARLDHAQPDVRRAALVALEEAGDARAVQRAEKMVRLDREVAVRFEAALVLFRAGHADADGYLIDALGSRNALIWITALGELERKYKRSFGRDSAAWKQFLASGGG